MKKNDVPQDNAKSFEGQRKALYAIDETGHYTVTPSSGWEAEEVVLDLAIAQYDNLTAEALTRAKSGLGSTLEYHMYRCRMDVTILAQSSGFFKWQVKRHLKPGALEKLSPAKQERYVDALGLPLAELTQVPTVHQVDTQ